MKVTVKIPGTCGELVQGEIAGQNFLISFPVNKYTEITLKLNHSGIVSVSPSWCIKVKKVVKNTLAYLGEEKLGAQVHIKSDLPVGKGWASSSADILGAISGVAAALYKEIKTEQIVKLALQIEPTDGIFIPGLAIFDHVNGTKLEPLGPSPFIQLLACEFDSTVDTLSFNKRIDLAKLNKKKEDQVVEALKLVTSGVAEGDIIKVAQGATISALAHQQILYKPYLNKILTMSLENGALGVNIAHSGTTIGILFSKDFLIEQNFIKSLTNQIPGIEQIHHLQAICGGVKLLSNSPSLGGEDIEYQSAWR